MIRTLVDGLDHPEGVAWGPDGCLYAGGEAGQLFDRVGNLYVSDSGSWPDGGGCIYRVAPFGRTEVWSDDVPRFANGLTLAPDQSSLYAVQSTLPGVTWLPINADGTAGPPELVVRLPDTVPDGLAFDRDGRLYISCYRPDRIYLLGTDGELRVFVEDILGTLISAPTNIAFGRADLSSLFVASLGRWHIGERVVPVPGAPLNYPKLPTR